jgi:hypothetical protein
MDDGTATIAMGVNDPTPVISGNDAAITPRPTGSAELVSDDFRACNRLQSAECDQRAWNHSTRRKSNSQYRAQFLHRWKTADN